MQFRENPRPEQRQTVGHGKRETDMLTPISTQEVRGNFRRTHSGWGDLATRGWRRQAC